MSKFSYAAALAASLFVVPLPAHSQDKTSMPAAETPAVSLTPVFDAPKLLQGKACRFTQTNPTSPVDRALVIIKDMPDRYGIPMPFHEETIIMPTMGEKSDVFFPFKAGFAAIAVKGETDVGLLVGQVDNLWSLVTQELARHTKIPEIQDIPSVTDQTFARTLLNVYSDMLMRKYGHDMKELSQQAESLRQRCAEAFANRPAAQPTP